MSTTAGLQPRPHQVEALTDLATALAVHDRTQLVMACGTGKTLVGRWHAQASEATRILVLLPSLGLVAQTLREWRRANRGSKWNFHALVVCSDPTTVEGAAERAGDDGSADLNEKDWTSVGAEVTTSITRTARFLNRPAGGAQVVFSTYHSSPVVAAAQRHSPDAFDLVLCDEAHRLAGQPSEAFTTVLDARKIVARKRVFMTATPRVYGGENGTSMDDPRVFGPVAHTVTFGDAIQAGLLTDYQVAVIAHSPADPDDPAAAVGTVAGAVLQAIDTHGLRRILSFHGTVGKAAAFASVMNGRCTKAGVPVGAEYMSSQMKTGTRAGLLNWLASDVAGDEARLIANARCLTEGIDVPSVDGVVFSDQRTSVVDIIQAIGRVLRPAPGKAIGTIVLPVVVEDAEDPETELSLSTFGTVWTVLRALRAHDQRFDDELNALQLEQVSTKGGTWKKRPSRVLFDLPVDLHVPDVELRLLTETGSLWERNYALLTAWADQHDARLLPRGEKVDHAGAQVNLGEWAEQQRIAHRRGVLSPDRSRRLELVPGWAWDKAAARWTATVGILADYAAQHGTVAEAPSGPSRFQGMKDAETPRRDLGVWMATQRQAYRLGTLSDCQVAMLEELPGWDWNAGLPRVDVDMIEALRIFVEFEKHALVPDDHREDGLRLGSWCWAVRRRRWTGTIAPALFDEIRAATPSKFREGHFDWAKNDTLWRIGYAALRQYTEREGTATPAGRFKEQLPDTTVSLGQWAALQRMTYRRGELDPRLAQLLEALPGWAWEIDLQTAEAQDPVDLPEGSRHGTAGSYSNHKCRCAECLEWRRSADRARLAAARDHIEDPVDAVGVLEHLQVLEQLGVKRGVMVAASGVPLGAIRKVFKGTLRMERAHRDRLLEMTLESCESQATREGSRGRTAAAANERIDSGPTWVLVDDLAARGFGIHWISRELGYVGGVQLRRDGKVLRRVHDSIRDLYLRVGDLVMPPLPVNTRRPSLADLQAAAGRDASAVA